ncbi:MAG: putative metal-dependent hydrolase [Bacteroidia bacterium]|nr:putative metal-dependent hydrolase [Bacteroidia bacterium]
MSDKLYKLKYPVGEFQKPDHIDTATLKKWQAEIIIFPVSLANSIKDLTEDQLSWRYRPDGWTIRQVVHHCADSHMNSFSRFKLCLTENSPEIKPYDEAEWAKLSDTVDCPVEDSLLLLTGLHKRWGVLMGALSESDMKREFVHPEHGKRFSLDETIGNYAWHCRHHLAHINQAIEGGGKYNM